MQDADEPGLEGWTIYLDINGSGAYEEATDPSQLTDADGNYSFSVEAGVSYTVAEVVQNGWRQSEPGDPGSVVVSVAAGATQSVDFGNYQPATIVGLKFNDRNGDGSRQGGDEGLPGWHIYVDVNLNGRYDAGEPDDMTDGEGRYEITGLKPGVYRVAEEMQDGWEQVFPGGFTPAIDDHGESTGELLPFGSARQVIDAHLDVGSLYRPHHFFQQTGDEHHFAWLDHDASTPDVIDIFYDFRGIGSFNNQITAVQIALAESAFDAWEVAAGGAVNFVRDVAAPVEDIINIGVGDLAALGEYQSGPRGILALGGGTFGEIRVGQSDAGVTVNVRGAPSGAKLDAWIDFDGDGTWGGPGEQIFVSMPVNEGDNDLLFDVPGSATGGNSYARFRLSTEGGLDVGGLAADGEVEDYILWIHRDSDGVRGDVENAAPNGGDGNQDGDIDVGAATIVTLLLHSERSPDGYFKYGPTPDDPTDHWYDFSFDGQTGAQILANRIELHFVDGQRGDVNTQHCGVRIVPTVCRPTTRRSVASKPRRLTGRWERIR